MSPSNETRNATSSDIDSSLMSPGLIVSVRPELARLVSIGTAQNGVDSLIIPADLAKPGEPERIIAEIEKAGRQVDGLVNNAGAGQPGYFAETEWADQERFLQLMVTAYLQLIHLVLPGMEERRFGRIINVSSGSHYHGTIDFEDLQFEKRSYKGMKVYAQSKLANVLFTKELADMLKGKTNNAYIFDRPLENK